MTRHSTSEKTEPDSAAPFVPVTRSLKVLAEAANNCRGCELYRHATQVVFGAGPRTVRLVLVGEQPGDREDKAGQPFVGPAGLLLEECLKEVPIDRCEIYLTNAVKHFKFEQQGKRRLHKKPSAREVRACRPWLEKEFELLRPEVLICLGATAIQAVLGSGIRVTVDRGRKMESKWCEQTFVTLHPSAILRAPDSSVRGQMKSDFIDDLKYAAAHLRSGEVPSTST